MEEEIRVENEPAISEFFERPLLNPVKNKPEISESLIKQEIYLGPEQISNQQITTVNLPGFRFYFDCCEDIFEDSIKLFKDRQTYNFLGFDKIKNKSFRKLCFSCPLQFDCINFNDGYLKIQKGMSELEVSCDFCKKYLTNKMIYHGCHLCNISSFITCKQLFNHLKRVHKTNEPYQCIICGSVFINVTLLTTHIRNHTGEKPFTYPQNLKKHENLHTGARDVKQYSCKFCDKKYTRSHNMKAHIRNHTGESPYKCNYCSKQFSSRKHLKRHLKIHTDDKSFICQYCDRKFRYAHQLKKHTSVHTGIKPYPCKFCDKKFTGSSNLRAHIRIHTGEKPYTCNYCNKKFNSVEYLGRHKRIHTGEKSFICNYCDRKFRESQHLKRHLLIHTRIKSKKK